MKRDRTDRLLYAVLVIVLAVNVVVAAIALVKPAITR